MSDSRRRVLLVQLPIPPPGMQPVRGNVPLAAGYLKLFARKRGLEDAFAIEILPAARTNTLGDQGLVDEILGRQPWLVGFTCYVWNIERTLWIAQRLKQARPEIGIVLGGPEITPDNAWVLAHPAVDHAVIGEGEQTFAELLHALHETPSFPRSPWERTASDAPRRRHRRRASAEAGSHAERGNQDDALHAGIAGSGRMIPGLWSRGMNGPPVRRTPLKNLDEISSPYLEGILDAADEQTLFLETVRGCAFRCKFCYYPKSYDAVYSVSYEKIAANLRHAAERGAKEIVILDPTLNQRRDFAEFLRLLARHNADRQWTCFGELRAEGIDAEKARLLRAAGFTEVEVGLQSLDPHAQDLMDRKVNLKAFERGVKAMLDEGLTVRVDLILGLPGDTADSVRRSIEYLDQSKLYSAVQVFNLSILPGTAFRHEASQLALEFQARPPYYVLKTPTLSLEQLYELMDEAQEAFGLEFDPWTPPAPADGGVPGRTAFPGRPGRPGKAVLRDELCSQVCIDLDRESAELPSAGQRAQAFSLCLRSADFHGQRDRGSALIRRVLEENPHTSLDVLLEPVGGLEWLTEEALASFLKACFQTTSYLDLYYSLHPNQLLGAKRLVVVLPMQYRNAIETAESDQIAQYATIAWRDETGEVRI